MNHIDKPYTHKAARLIAEKQAMFGTPDTHVIRSVQRRGVTLPALGLKRIKSGERRMDIDELIAIFDVLDIPLSALTDD